MAVRTPRPYHHGNLRATLLAAAERTLAEGGVGALSLRELARQVGVSHAAPRRHFAHKQALLDALAEDGFQRLGAALRAGMDASDPTFDAQLRAFGRSYVRFATEHGALIELMFAGKHRPDASEGLRRAADEAFEAPLSLVSAGQAAGAVVTGDPERLGTVAFAALQGIAVLANSGMLEAAALDQTIEDAVDRLLLGFRPR